MTLSGSLSNWSVNDLLSMFNVTKKTGTLRLSGSRAGAIHFEDGRVVAAEVAGNGNGEATADRTEAVDALFMLSAASDGHFEMGAYEGPVGSGWDVAELLSDVSRLDSLHADVEEAGLSKAPLMLADHIDAPVTVAIEDWWALASLVSVLSLDQLEDVFGRARAIRLLHTLWRLGVIEALQGDEIDLVGIGEEHAAVAETDDGAEGTGSEPSDGTEPSGRDEESWLDEIAAATERELPAEPVSIEERRNLRGISAPASTTLTGPVLDDMRRLRGRAGD